MEEGAPGPGSSGDQAILGHPEDVENVYAVLPLERLTRVSPVPFGVMSSSSGIDLSILFTVSL